MIYIFLHYQNGVVSECDPKTNLNLQKSLFSIRVVVGAGLDTGHWPNTCDGTPAGAVAVSCNCQKLANLP